MRGAVIGTADDERVVEHAVVFQSIKDFAVGVIGFHDEVSVRVQAAFALPFFAGHGRAVRGIPRHVEEKWAFAFAALDVLHCGVGKLWQHFNGRDVLCDFVIVNPQVHLTSKGQEPTPKI